ncbi:hypothetical protein DM02DRAFT_628720 [Periconia macrospinosa]|uniref:Uncharacterized protein n=1 Tax=Periconia macrospinosa TaxID=97972 RepID=A0A2V1DSF9_9PLEO|nr:hypothetical protein DM02DRAFT_628720 [Periconia macrospinosa]
MASSITPTAHTDSVALPRVAITYCTQCRWMLRAAYFGQELLSTFGTQIGEVALIPVTGGVFRVELTYIPPSSSPPSTSQEQDEQSHQEGIKIQKALLWDRKTEGGFPETKVLKQRVRDYVDPNRDLGHSDVGGKKKKKDSTTTTTTTETEEEGGKKEEEGKEVGEGKKEEDGKEVKRNPDGSICEDCR